MQNEQPNAWQALWGSAPRGTAAAARSLTAIAVSALALVLAVRQVDLLQVAGAIQSLALWPVAAALVLTAAGLWTRAERWRWLLQPDGNVSRGPVLRCLMIGYLGNAVLPFRLGELARVVSVAPVARVSVAFAAAGVLVEKVLDIATLLLLLVLLGAGVQLPAWAGYTSLATGALIVASIVGLLVLARYQIYWIELLARRVPRLATASLATQLGRLAEGLDLLGSRRVQAYTLGWSLASWTLGVLFHVCLLWAFGISPLLPAAVLLLAATNLSMVVPAAPSSLGVYHYLCVLALAAFAIPTDRALAYAFVSHALTNGLVIVLGVPALALATPTSVFRPRGAQLPALASTAELNDA